jgi:hypothetical protein
MGRSAYGLFRSDGRAPAQSNLSIQPQQRAFISRNLISIHAPLRSGRALRSAMSLLARQLELTRPAVYLLGL